MSEGQLRGDTIANLAAFGVLAVSGVVLNLGLMAVAGEAALGVFNQLYALYVVASQVAAFGIHMAVHREVAAGERPAGVSLATGLRLVLVPSTVVAASVALASGAIGVAVDSPAVGAGAWWLGAALVPFAVNKVLTGALAGGGRLQAFAAVQIVRIVVLVAVTLGMAASGDTGGGLALGFGVAELAILPGLLVLLRPQWTAGSLEVAREQLRFGAQALPHGLIAESFLRVDVLMLAPFVSDASVGIYSLAAMCAEGLYQVGGTVRQVIGPRMIPLLTAESGVRSARRRLLWQAMAMGAGVFAVVAGGLGVGFPWLGWVIDPGVVSPAHQILLLLMAGMAVNAAFVPLDTLLLWAGRPALQSAWMAANLLINVALNGLLIPELGIYGAAVATALAWACAALTLQLAVWGALRWRGGVLGQALGA